MRRSHGHSVTRPIFERPAIMILIEIAGLPRQIRVLRRPRQSGDNRLRHRSNATQGGNPCCHAAMFSPPLPPPVRRSPPRREPQPAKAHDGWPHHRRRPGPHLAHEHAGAAVAGGRHRAGAHPAAVLLLRAPGPHGRGRRRPPRHHTAVLGGLSQRIRHGGREEVAAPFRGDGAAAPRRSEIEGGARDLEGPARHAGRPPHLQPPAEQLAHRRHRRLVLAGRRQGRHPGDDADRRAAGPTFCASSSAIPTSSSSSTT